MVVDTAAALLAEVGGVLVVPMTLLRQEYRDEIFGGLASRRIPVRHVLLSPEETILRERIAAREEVAGRPGGERTRSASGAYEHIEPYRARSRLAQPPTRTPSTPARLTPRETAERIAEAVRTGAADACDIVQTPEPTAETLAAGVLLFDDQDRVLLVDPTYKPGWEFPGGVVEPGEAPARAGMREVAEETRDTARRRMPRCWSSTGSRRTRPGTAGCGCSSTAAGSQRRGRGTAAAARRRTARLAVRHRGGGRGTAAARAATSGCAGPCGPAERATVLNLEAGVPGCRRWTRAQTLVRPPRRPGAAARVHEAVHGRRSRNLSA